MDAKKDCAGYASDGVKIDGKNDGTVIDKVVNWFKGGDKDDMNADPKNDGGSSSSSKPPVHVMGNNTGTVNNHEYKYKN